MRLFLTILEGPSPREALPIMATEDPELIRTVGEQLARRLTGARVEMQHEERNSTEFTSTIEVKTCNERHGSSE